MSRPKICHLCRRDIHINRRSCYQYSILYCGHLYHSACIEQYERQKKFLKYKLFRLNIWINMDCKS